MPLFMHQVAYSPEGWTAILSNPQNRIEAVRSAIEKLGGKVVSGWSVSYTHLILDACLREDPNSRVACETLTCTGLVVIAGEITTKAYVDFQSLVRGVVQSIGYDNAVYGFDSNTCAVISSINKQSGDIAMGVDTGGAGDQGMMFGFACNETPELMPLPISLAHKLTQKLSEVRKNGTCPYLRPDGKSQVTVEYDAQHKVKRVDAVVVSTQHSENVGNDDLRADILKHVIQAVIPAHLLDEDTKYHICLLYTSRCV